ncbi:hypothetical protein ACFGVR_19265 [Mucilaginibacter sp. AW1-3]
MKTSNKFILSAFVIFIIVLMVYNAALKAEYQTGKYKDPLSNYTSYNINGFDKITITGASMMHVIVKQGEFSVLRNKHSQDSVKITKVGNRLLISIHFDKLPAQQPGKHEAQSIWGYNEIVISCPKLNLLETNIYTDETSKNPIGISYTPSLTEFDPNSVKVHDFKLDSLLIRQNEGIIDLKTNTINTLKTIVNGTSHLIIHKDNQINTANLAINYKSLLKIDQLNIGKFECTVADEARIDIPGAALKHLISK